MKSSPTIATSCPTISIPVEWAEHGETITRLTFKLSIGGVTGKRDRAEVDFWPCAIFLSLYDRIYPETRKRDPHHAGIKKLPSAFMGTNLRSFIGSFGRTPNVREKPLRRWSLLERRFTVYYQINPNGPAQSITSESEHRTHCVVHGWHCF